MTYKIKFLSIARKDYEIAKKSPYAKKLKKLLEILKNDPFQYPPAFEKLLGDLSGYYSRRINDQHRLVYSVEDDVVNIYYCWQHYKD